ncbi:FixH family protein [Brevibacillus fulvus]|uniref:YtkA-like domain-containing protein n=1 Tax=Brevibacillus fulvus TaxID=1125967 RepID=A0A938Y3S9_9BACL|nr:FixH family protein [Brevibacillus fulvus]MBM7591072.1 hypothetical protein [Brevibacillus fulvus]
MTRQMKYRVISILLLICFTSVLVACSPKEGGNTNVGERKVSAQEEHHHETEHEVEQSSVIIHLSSEIPKIVSGQETVFNTHIMQSDLPLTNAKVRFEIWKEGEEKHSFHEATETGDGNYKLAYRFEQPQLHHLIVHVEKNSLHGHKKFKINVRNQP